VAQFGDGDASDNPIAILGFIMTHDSSTMIVLDYYNPNREADRILLYFTDPSSGRTLSTEVAIGGEYKELEVIGRTALDVQLRSWEEFVELRGGAETTQLTMDDRLVVPLDGEVAAAMRDRTMGVSNAVSVQRVSAPPP